MNKAPNNTKLYNNTGLSRINNTRNSNTRVNSSTSTGYSSTNVFGIVLLVVVILLIAGAIYWAYGVYSSQKFQTSMSVEALPDVKDASSKFAIGSGSIPNSKYSNEYSISMWLNILDYTYNYGKEKIILRRGTAGSSNLEILLGDKDNDLIVRLKMQGPAPTSALTVSNFADVPSTITTIASDTHQINTAGNPFLNVKDAGCGVFNKISGNVIDYPTIKYNVEGGCDNVLTTLKPSDAMTIMLEQAINMKDLNEGFTSTSFNGNTTQLGQIDMSKISDNSAPQESQVIYNDYFKMVSGNKTVSNGKLERYSNMPSIKGGIKEHFDATSDLINASVNVLLDICNILNVLKAKATADNSVDSMNTNFQKIIDNLEKYKTTAKTSDDISTSIGDVFGTAFENNSLKEQLSDLLIKLSDDNDKLQELSANTSVDFATLQTAVNSKLASANCPLSLNGATEVDATINFYQNFVNLMKKSIYTYLNNLGSGVRKTYPDLSSQQSASCLVDTSSKADPTVGTCVYKMIPLQKWVHVIVSVYNQVVDIYIDGQLASSCVLKGFPAISTDDVNITPDGGFSGQISRVVFSNTAMTVPNARDLYYAGPVPTDSLFSMIPSWVWYGIVLLIVVAVIYSIFM